MTKRLIHKAKLWRWAGAEGTGSWHFVTIDGAAGEELSATALLRKLEGAGRGFGSLRVKARIGESQFATSVFPSKEQGWLLPVKASVRKVEGLADGDAVEVVIEVE